MDLITDLPDNPEGYIHVLVVVCYLTKFVAARALQSKTTKSVINALSEIYLIYGVPAIISMTKANNLQARFVLYYEIEN